MPIPTKNPNRVAGARKGWETRKQRQQEQEIERATAPPQFFFPGEGRDSTTATSANVTARALLNQYRSWQYIAARAIADRIMNLEPIVITQTRVSNGTLKEEILDDHPLKLLLDNPSPNFSIMQILRIVSLWLTQVGDAYLLKVEDNMGVVRELHPLSPGQMQRKFGDHGIAGYVFVSEAGQKTEYKPEEIVRIFSPDPAAPFEGVGNLGPQSIAYNTDLYLGQTLQKFYRDDATPKTVITAGPNAKLPTGDHKKRVDDDWLTSYSRRSGHSTGLPVWLPPDFALEVLSGEKLKDLVPLLEYYREKILASNGVPAPIIGLDKNVNRATARASIHVFDKHVIQPQANMIADALNRQLAPGFDPKLKIRFNNVVMEDMEFDLRQEDQDLRQAVRSINKVLADRGEDSVPWGDVPIPVQKMEVEEAEQDPAAKPPGDEEREGEEPTE